MCENRLETCANALERFDPSGFEKKFRLSCDIFCAKFSLTFAVRGVNFTFFDISNPIKIAVLTYFAQKGCQRHMWKPPGNVRKCAGKVWSVRFRKKNFDFLATFFCAKFSLTFAVRSVILTFFYISNPIKIAVLTHFSQKGCHTYGYKPPGNVRECAGRV